MIQLLQRIHDRVEADRFTRSRQHAKRWHGFYGAGIRCPWRKNGALLLIVQGNIGQNVVGMFEMPRRMQQAVQKT
ncbi:hypothetical protein X753_23685 [Mesorhizobium sp. LNJC399B00]|nr:hypothetical protein X753_23685 [Mesorhizobium sp. LNJC399B00]